MKYCKCKLIAEANTRALGLQHSSVVVFGKHFESTLQVLAESITNTQVLKYQHSSVDPFLNTIS